MEGVRQHTGGPRRSVLARLGRMLEFRGDERALATRAVAVIFLVGATLTAVTVAMPPPAKGSDLLILALGGVAAIAGIALLRIGRVSEPALGVTVAFGTALITAVTLEAGPGRGTNDNEVLYLWVLTYSFWFLRLPHALGQLALIGVADAILLADQASFGAATINRWLVTMVTFTLVGLLLSWVRGRVEHQREERARLAVLDERMRIAREIHDSTGHGVNVISIQATAALNALRTNPEAASEVLEAIKQTSRDTAEDMRRLLGVLRDRELTAEELSRASLANLDHLVEEYSGAGVPVEVVIRGESTALPSWLDQASYRIIEEALADVRNRAREGTTARVAIAYGSARLELEVLDDGGAHSPDGEDDPRELIGIRERIAAAGGELQASPRPNGGFRIHAMLPLDRRRS